MNHPRQLVILCLALALGALPVLAQPATTDRATAPDTPSAPPAPTKDSAPAVPPAAREPAPNSTPPGAGRDSPFDYRSSEEISEDLPVSFPVDI